MDTQLKPAYLENNNELDKTVYHVYHYLKSGRFPRHIFNGVYI